MHVQTVKQLSDNDLNDPHIGQVGETRDLDEPPSGNSLSTTYKPILSTYRLKTEEAFRMRGESSSRIKKTKSSCPFSGS